MMLFVCYPKCTTCQRAQQWLEAHQQSFQMRHIAEDKPTEAELRTWHARCGLPLRRFFNTSGKLYASLQLKNRLPSMTEDEQYALLSSDGMLVKRPLLITDDRVLVGFRESEWETLL